ncbi:MAG TPA: cell division protein CrgA [Marmoricola sp.]
MSKRGPRTKLSTSGYPTSITRCAIALLLVIVGIAWLIVYYHSARDLYGTKHVAHTLSWMTDLKRWNYVIGFGLILIGMMVSAHPKTPVGRGRGVVIGMLFSFLFGLLYVVVYYFLGDNLTKVPVMNDLNQYNLLVGVGFMAVGFSFATKWE